VSPIQECEYSQVARFRSAAAKERVCLKPTANTRWFRYGEEGCAGLLTLNNGAARIKGVFVDQSRRREGIGTAITEFLIQTAQEAGCKSLEAYAWNPAWYQERGFTAVGKNAAGAVRMRKELAR